MYVTVSLGVWKKCISCCFSMPLDNQASLLSITLLIFFLKKHSNIFTEQYVLQKYECIFLNHSLMVNCNFQINCDDQYHID